MSSSLNIQQVVQSDELTMTSLKVAWLTGKRHSNVLRDIRCLLHQMEKSGEDISSLRYRIEYLPSGGRPVQNYLMNKSLGLLLITGYRPPYRDRLQLIQRVLKHFEYKG